MLKNNLILKGISGRIYKTNKKALKVGITTNVSANEHLIFLDYDNQKLEEIIKNLKFLQKKFMLPDFYIFKSSRGKYNAICFVVVHWRRYKSILANSSCDPNFRFYTYRAKKGTLRIAKKQEKKTSNVRLTHIVERKSIKARTFKGCLKEECLIKNKFFEVLNYENR